MVGTRIPRTHNSGEGLPGAIVIVIVIGVLLLGATSCDVVVGATWDTRPDSGHDAGCPPAPACNWCGGSERRDLHGCVVGYTCANGADPCFTPRCSQGGCAQGEECRSDDLCWPTCALQTEICNGLDDNCNGMVDDGATCPAGQACLNGSCTVSPKPCTTGSDCTAGQTCVNGLCSPELCAEDSECSSWQRCDNGSCTAQTCSADPDCGSGNRCINGLCSLTPCSTDADCGADQKCVGGSCWRECFTDADCDPADSCINGICR